MGAPVDVLAKLAPVEVDAYLAGHRRKLKENARLVAWQVATMINLWGSRAVTVGQLLGEEEEADDGAPYDVALEVERARVMREEKEAADADGWDAAAQLDDDATMQRLAALLEEPDA